MELVMTGGFDGADEMVKTRDAVPVPPALVALKATVETPAAAGVPEMRPVVVLTDMPAGKPAALKLVGLLVAVI